MQGRRQKPFRWQFVDDEYVILGSATRGPWLVQEIQRLPWEHTWAQKKTHPHGQVYGYRMSKWAEHLGQIQDHFSEPESLVCVRNINEFAEENWERFASDDFTPLPGHLLKYPIKIDVDGKVGPLPDYEHFLDVGGKILGAVSNLPNALITQTFDTQIS
ncbi:hypothetical protein L1987_52533 [Smallanthus sonchifolius]|uniref:Uncharacterized protein n=1 Tax=Smallanthus sonchifolius TaxID=185202 RepID=A0ACB9EU09_9ASTR|nr:hypothetical protein L1987_52533 [Smallanthus sonchifolius]